MTMLTVSPEQQQPTRQALAIEGRSAPRKVTGRLKVALDAMVWTGARRDQAAQQAGLTDHSLRSALKKPHVKAYYLGECEVLRTSGRARRIHRLEAMVEQDENKQAVINACKTLDYQEDQAQHNAARMQAPGFVIVVQAGPNTPMPHMRGNEPKPLIEHTSGSDDETALPNQGDADR